MMNSQIKKCINISHLMESDYLPLTDIHMISECNNFVESSLVVAGKYVISLKFMALDSHKIDNVGMNIEAYAVENTLDRIRIVPQAVMRKYDELTTENL